MSRARIHDFRRDGESILCYDSRFPPKPHIAYDGGMLSRGRFLGAAVSALAGCRRSGRTTIAVIPKATSHLFFVSIHVGVDRAAKEFGMNVLWNGPSEETDHARQMQ